MIKNPKWHRDEVILLIDLYFSLSYEQMDKSNEQVIALSNILNQMSIHDIKPEMTTFRNPSGIALKLQNIRHLDDGRGMRGHSKLDKSVFNEFKNQKSRLRQVANQIKASVQDSELSKKSKKNGPRDLIFGEISGIPEGYHFEGRQEMMPSSFHRQWGRGIDGNAKVGAAAIVLSGGYEDDEDNGHEIIYTGAGGRNSVSKKQIEDQVWTHNDNAAILKSMTDGLPIRVIRGSTHKSIHSPKQGYRYAGLYKVDRHWQETGKDGFQICRFRLLYAGNDSFVQQKEEAKSDLSRHGGLTKRKFEVVSRVIRNTKLSVEIKRLYEHKCQICRIALPTKQGKYAEGAHIRPLGKPHNGDDSASNILCLCPNHHVMFDHGSISIDDELNLIGAESGRLFVEKGHFIEKSNLRYHRTCHGLD